MKKLTLILMTIMIILTVTVTVLTTVSLSSQDVSLAFVPNPTIDIVLAKAKTTTSLTNFKTDMLNELENQGIDTSLVNITSIETENVDIANGFEWQQDISSSIGGINISSNGKDVTMKGNKTKPGKNAIWIIPERNEEQEFDFSYNIDYGDSFNAAGMLLRVKQSENTLTGYMLSFNNKSGDNWYKAAESNYGGIWEFTYVIGANSTNMTKTLRKGINIDKSGVLNVKVDDYTITVSGGGMSTPVSYTMDKEFGTGYGFFSDHYSHNCSQIGSFALTGINLKATTVRSFSEILREPDWRDNSIKVLVNVSDVINRELDGTSELGEVLTRLINENIYFTAWGKSANQTQFENLINSNNGNGKFINNSSYATSIQSTAEYIKSLIEQLDEINTYLLLGDNVKIASTPSDVLENTADQKYPYGRWKINHDFLYFENNIGQFSRSKQYISDMVKTFDKTGKYAITYEDKKISPQEIYVHRRPMALIKNIRNGNDINLNSNSYDLDLYSTGNKGIQEEAWQYKKTTENTWTNGKLTTLTNDTDYVVQLKVKDYQNTWSYPISIYATSREEAKPIATFRVKNNEITKYEELEIIDTSYDPYGGIITSSTWEVYKEDGTKIYSGSEPLTNYDTIGSYTMRLTVKNDRNLTSETYSRKFKITEDSIPPEVLVNPENCDWQQSVTVNLEFSDLGGSNFKNYRYAITDTPTMPTTWSDEIVKTIDNINIMQEGEKYLHIIATDNAGNVSEDRILGPYFIDNSVPIIEVTGDFDNINIDTLTIDVQCSDILSGVKQITINGQEISNGEVTFNKNGIYTIFVEDNVGKTITKDLDIKNIYYECKAGLEHPIYSSSYDECPICSLIKGLKVTNKTNVYDNLEHRVQYENPQNATIIEYYNQTKNLPKKAGKYSYDLKVVYQDKEYNTGVVGEYEITRKEIQIVDIIAPDKIYNGTDVVTIQGGRLLNVCDGNDVQFKLPYLAKAESKNIGNHKLKLDNIILIGDDANNYTLRQPEYGEITVNILQKNIAVEKIKTQTKKYDKNNIIKIISGEIVGKVEEDDLDIQIPETGLADSHNVGTWNVSIEPITLIGKDSQNYNLIQPNKEDIIAIIEKAEGILKIGCNSKKFDRETVNPYIIENNSTAEVSYKFYKAETNEEIEVPWDIGEYEVVGIMESDGNYTEIVTERLPFVITKPDEPIMKLESTIVQINGEDVEQKEVQSVRYKDTIKLSINVSNIGVGSGYVSKVFASLPDGIEFLEDDEINQKYKWKITDSGKLETDIYSFDNNFESELQGNADEKENLDNNIENTIENSVINNVTNEVIDNQDEVNDNEETEFRKLELLVKVTKDTKENIQFVTELEIEQQDKHGDNIKYSEETIGYSQKDVLADLKYFDVCVDKKIDKITLTNIETKQVEEFDVYQHKGEIIKAELSEKRIANSIATIKYHIILKNDGSLDGVVDNIIDILPNGVGFDILNNPDWKINSKANAEYTKPITLKSGETKKVELIVTWDLRNTKLGARKNQVVIDAENDLDQILMEEEKIQLKDSNNFAFSEILISVPTGNNITPFIILGIGISSVLGIAIYNIKKYVI